jgi:hypothetical protein
VPQAAKSLQALSPTLGQAPKLVGGVEHLGARFPRGFGDLVVFQVKRVLFGHLVDGALSLFNVAECHLNPDIFEDIGNLSKEIVNALQAFGEEVVYAVLDRPLRCSRRVGFQGKSKLIRVPSRCKFNPSLAASVPSNSRMSPCCTRCFNASRGAGKKTPSAITPERGPPA